MEVSNHPDSILLVAELLLLRLLEEEVVQERLRRVLEGPEEVPQLVARLLAPSGSFTSGLFLSAVL